MLKGRFFFFFFEWSSDASASFSNYEHEQRFYNPIKRKKHPNLIIPLLSYNHDIETYVKFYVGFSNALFQHCHGNI